jgi:23S rRNA (uridine2552-2'-O)-methyltransferase
MKTKEQVMEAILQSSFSTNDKEAYDDENKQTNLTQNNEYCINWYDDMAKHKKKQFFYAGRADVIMSDMAANFTGDRITDALRTIDLCEHALEFAVGSPSNPQTSHTLHQIGFLNIGGTFLCKFFNCGRQYEQDLRDSIQLNFQRHVVIKPPASRKESSEQYLLATGYHGNQIMQNIFQDN